MNRFMLVSFVVLSCLFGSIAVARDGEKKPADVPVKDKAPKSQPDTADKDKSKDPSKPAEGAEQKKPAKSPPKVKAAAIASAAARMATSMKCSGCGGSGDSVVKGDKVNDGKGVGGDMAPAKLQPKKGTRKIDDCKGCDGVGLKKGDVVWQIASNFVRDLSRRDTADGDWEKSRKKAAGDGLQEVAQLGLVRLAGKLNEPAMEVLFSAGAEPKQQNVAFVGGVAKAPEVGAGDIVVSTSRGYVLLRSPVISRCMVREEVFVGGVWTSMTTVKVITLDEKGSESLRDVPARVLETAFVVAP